jgi:hypothetical protein
MALFPHTIVFSEMYAMTDEDGTRYEWDVALGRRLVEARYADSQDFCPAEHAITPEHIRARCPELDEGYAATLTGDDLARPLLFLPFRGRHLLLIDGWHRLFRCVTAPPGEAPSCLPAYLLTEDEARQILLSRMPAADSAPQTKSRKGETRP